MKTNYQIGDTAYIVEHCQWTPPPDMPGEDAVEISYSERQTDVFPSLVRAIAHAKKVCKTDFWGQAEVYEARLSNPYSDVLADHRVKRSALEWKQVDGGYESTIERD